MHFCYQKFLSRKIRARRIPEEKARAAEKSCRHYLPRNIHIHLRSTRTSKPQPHREPSLRVKLYNRCKAIPHKLKTKLRKRDKQIAGNPASEKVETGEWPLRVSTTGVPVDDVSTHPQIVVEKPFLQKTRQNHDSEKPPITDNFSQHRISRILAYRKRNNNIDSTVNKNLHTGPSPPYSHISEPCHIPANDPGQATGQAVPAEKSTAHALKPSIIQEEPDHAPSLRACENCTRANVVPEAFYCRDCDHSWAVPAPASGNTWVLRKDTIECEKQIEDPGLSTILKRSLAEYQATGAIQGGSKYEVDASEAGEIEMSTRADHRNVSSTEPDPTVGFVQKNADQEFWGQSQNPETDPNIPYLREAQNIPRCSFLYGAIEDLCRGRGSQSPKEQPSRGMKVGVGSNATNRPNSHGLIKDVESNQQINLSGHAIPERSEITDEIRKKRRRGISNPSDFSPTSGELRAS